MAVTPKGKRQVVKLTKKQLGFEFGRNVLNTISNIAAGVRDLVEKGQATDQRTGQRITVACTPDDIKRSWSTEQLIAVEDFISTWAVDPEPVLPPSPERQLPDPKKKRSRKQPA